MTKKNKCEGNVELPLDRQARVIEMNSDRPRLSILDLVRCYKRVKPIAQGRKGPLPGSDLIASLFGVSAEMLDRWLPLLDLPLPLQAAIDAGELTREVAVKVLALPAATQEDIAEQVRQGKPPYEAIRPYVRGTPARTPIPAAAVRRLTRSLERAQMELGGLVDDMEYGGLVDNSVEILRAARPLLDALIGRLEVNRKARLAKLAKLQALLPARLADAEGPSTRQQQRPS
jgi:hypothetical protein